MTLTKAELADLLFEQLGLNKREAKDMVERFFEEIRIALNPLTSVRPASASIAKPYASGRNPR
jgi:integration host factor subunit alpha